MGVFNMAKKIVLYNHKGGTGKSTSTVNIATYTALTKSRVLVIDMDPQGNCSTNFRFNIYDLEDNTKTLVDVLDNKANIKEAYVTFDEKGIETLKLLPSDNRMNDKAAFLETNLDKYNILNNILKEVDKDFDYIFIDSPPQVSVFSYNALFASDYILIPFKPGQFEIAGLKQLFDLFEKVKVLSKNTPQILGIIITMYQMNNAAKAKMLEVSNTYKDLVFLSAPIPLSADIGQATINCSPIHFFKSNIPAANAYRELTKQIIERIKNKREE